MRIVSLLPATTEIACALGAGADLVGVTHECDFPSEVSNLRRVTRTRIPRDAAQAEIDRLVTTAAAGGPPTEELDVDALRQLDPEVILTQDLCAVCAVPAGRVDDALASLGCRAEVVSFDPGSVEEILDGVLRIGTALERAAAAEQVVRGLRSRLDVVAARVEGRPRPKVLTLEWGDPLFNAGHWIPDMVALAGGAPTLANPGRDSTRISWEDVAASGAEVVVFAPCGLGLDAAADLGRALLDHDELAGARVVVAVDADAYFVRPGPRVVDGIEQLSGVLHPGLGPPLAGVVPLR